MGNNLYDLHEVMIHWEVSHANSPKKESVNLYSFHLCVGKQVSQDFREFLADLDERGIREFAQTCQFQISDNDTIRIIDTECHPISSLGYIRDTDISDMRNRFIVHRG